MVVSVHLTARKSYNFKFTLRYKRPKIVFLVRNDIVKVKKFGSMNIFYYLCGAKNACFYTKLKFSKC